MIRCEIFWKQTLDPVKATEELTEELDDFVEELIYRGGYSSVKIISIQRLLHHDTGLHGSITVELVVFYEVVSV